jgi:Xaa-Pro dipeptidase
VTCGYIADFTRVFVVGELPPPLAAAHETSLRIQAAVVAAARPGVPCRELYDLARRAAAADGLADHFMGHGSGQVRFVGHGVGVELDELPVIAATDRPLAQSNVFALEPKFVLPGLGAVGVENTWHVGADGLECLTPAPESVVRVE